MHYYPNRRYKSYITSLKAVIICKSLISAALDIDRILNTLTSADTLTSLINKSFTSSRKFPSNLKLADITPIYKKKNPQAKENYRPVSVLPVLSKVFERLMQK